ncbi:MAG: hypothetical protein LC115_01020 [Bacteroidia bacterium]|nr:hypothetical protein [Bacteroidia bacterium]
MKQLFNYLVFIGLALFLSCGSDKQGDVGVNSPSGINGSTSAFTVVGNYLYILDGQNLQVWNVSTPSQPTLVTVFQTATSNPETIFGADSLLLVGTRSGVIFYSLANPENPVWLSTYSHITSCDPVVAQGRYAYLTLRTGTPCQRGINLFEIVDFSNLQSPISAFSINMNNPKGLAVNGNYAYVCENQGIQVINVANPQNASLLNRFGAFDGSDVIFYDNKLIITAKDGIYQYDVSNINTPIQLSRLLYSL